MLPRESDLMSDSILYRAIVGAELRADTAGRTIHGVVVPYNERAEIDDVTGSYSEMFIRGSFTRSRDRRAQDTRSSCWLSTISAVFRSAAPTSLVEQDDGLRGAFEDPPDS